MNTPLLTSSQFTSSQSHAASAEESCKAVILKSSGYLLALPATAVLKIVPFSAVKSRENGGLVMWQDQPLMLLNLHPLLAPMDPEPWPASESPPVQKKFWVVARSQNIDRCAIEADELPTFQEIPLSKVQPLTPHHYRLTGGVASHVAIFPYRGVIATILLLDLQQVVYRWHVMLQRLHQS